MTRPFIDCSLRAAFAAAPPGFAAMCHRLAYQGGALGMYCEPAPGLQSLNDFSFDLHTPFTEVVHTTVHGWGQGNPRPVSEMLLQAASGLMSVHGRAAGGVRQLGVDYVSTLASVLALQGSIACAVGQFRGGRFERCETSLYSAALLAIGQYLAGATAPEDTEQLLPGQHPADHQPPFVSADGVRFELEALEAEPWLRFWSMVGIAREVAGTGWRSFQLRYAKAIAPQPAALLAAVATLPYAQLYRLATESGIAICAVRALAERARDPESALLLAQGPWAFSFSGRVGKDVPLPPPGKLPLSGLTIVESCRRIQGPLAGHLLASLGADVIRIEPPGGDPLRGMPPMAAGCSARFDALNRLKTVVEIDLKSAAGPARLKELVRHADVFLHNWAPGKAAEFGLDRDDLHQVQPRLIYAYAGGWSGASDAPGLPGTDFMAQAWTGVASRIAESSCTRGGTLFTALDVLGGAVAAQGITAALFGRCMANTGGAVYTSLAGAASLLCADALEAMAEGEDVSPDVAIEAVFATADGLLAVHCGSPPSRVSLSALLGIAPDLDTDELVRQLERILLEKRATQWLALFEDAGIPAVLVVDDLGQLPVQALASRAITVDVYAQVNSPWSFT
ncbi:crotonobetainyl-CoA:carnitine CoA-transferase CaiB-like acyl-CoA transferase [Herbaspirillum rubrisubalbicans]|uniref:CoA transferase n=1 Tax=Herbaspirillum rubrisubalbicans TaxID=80842 RepID=UPI0020A20290|nr:CoA transferase [Herbaspirillum rubrisubalbicans]MCP1575888.1 crotonobetainyl-CoA:carnitine CoA-transferase CaiB-like acyl-CoA transferase [Herbaspirillum rubrisubalbicans]